MCVIYCMCNPDVGCMILGPLGSTWTLNFAVFWESRDKDSLFPRVLQHPGFFTASFCLALLFSKRASLIYMWVYFIFPLIVRNLRSGTMASCRICTRVFSQYFMCIPSQLDQFLGPARILRAHNVHPSLLSERPGNGLPQRRSSAPRALSSPWKPQWGGFPMAENLPLCLKVSTFICPLSFAFSVLLCLIKRRAYFII